MPRRASRAPRRSVKRTTRKRRVSRRAPRRLGPATNGSGSLYARPVGAKTTQRPLKGAVALWKYIAGGSNTDIISRPENNYQTGLVDGRVSVSSDAAAEWWMGVPHMAANSPLFLNIAKTFGQVKFKSVTLSYLPMRSLNQQQNDNAFPGTVTFCPDTSEQWPGQSTQKSCSANLATGQSQVVDYQTAWTVTVPLLHQPAVTGVTGFGNGAITPPDNGWLDLDMVKQQWKVLTGLFVFTVDHWYNMTTGGSIPAATYYFGHIHYSVECDFRATPDTTNLNAPVNADVPGVINTESATPGANNTDAS